MRPGVNAVLHMAEELLSIIPMWQVAEGEAGEIWVSGPSVAAGYWGRYARQA